MNGTKRIPLSERLKALPSGNYHPLYNVFVSDLCASMATLDTRFAGVYETELAQYDRRNEEQKDNRLCEYIYRTGSLPIEARSLILYKLLIEPFAWLAQQGGADE